MSLNTLLWMSGGANLFRNYAAAENACVNFKGDFFNVGLFGIKIEKTTFFYYSNGV